MYANSETIEETVCKYKRQFLNLFAIKLFSSVFARIVTREIQQCIQCILLPGKYSEGISRTNVSMFYMQ
jgi:hypothetical protein